MKYKNTYINEIYKIHIRIYRLMCVMLSIILQTCINTRVNYSKNSCNIILSYYECLILRISYKLNYLFIVKS